MDSQSLEALHPSLSCGHLENRRSWEYFGRLQCRLRVKLSHRFQAKCSDPNPGHQKRDGFDGKSFFLIILRLLMLLNLYLFRSWRCLIFDGSSSGYELNALSVPAPQLVRKVSSRTKGVQGKLIVHTMLKGGIREI